MAARDALLFEGKPDHVNGLPKAKSEWRNIIFMPDNNHKVSKTRREVLSAAERKARQRFIREARRIRSQRPSVTGQFPATEEMLREDRAR
jgi:hypothetical protein